MKDTYPNMPEYEGDHGVPQDPAYQTGRGAGNPLSQTTHGTTVESLAARGQGTLTSQRDVAAPVTGRGRWKDGRWEVVFIRPPSDGALLAAERKRLSKADGWDRLLRETGAFGIHWEDHAAMQGLDIPEWSHLTRESATRFTRAYVEVLRRDVPWLRTRLSESKSARRE